MERFLNKREVSEILRVSVRQVDYLRANRSLPWLNFGNLIRFDENAVRAWALSQRGENAVPSLRAEGKEVVNG